MSIAQFDPSSIKGAAAQIGATAAKSTANGDFARLLNDAQTQASLDTQRQNARRTAAAAATDQPVNDKRAASTTPKTSPSKPSTADDAAADKTDKTDKTRAAHHADRHDTTSADAQAATPTIVLPPVPAAVPTTVAATGSGTAGTGDDSTAGATTQSAASTPATGSPVNANASDAATQAAAATTAQAAPLAAAAAVTTPALATLAALGLGLGPMAGAGSNAAPAGGKATPATGAVSVTKAPAAVKLGSLTTALPLDVGSETAAPAAQPATVTPATATPAAAAPATAASTNAASAAAAADANAADQANANADAPPTPAPFPADLAAALATTATTSVTAEPAPVTVAATATGQHASLFAQGGDDTTSSALTNGTTPTAPGFATVNAGTTVSRTETAADTPQNGQSSQTPLQLPAEQLAVAISRNAGKDGSQNFTIRLSPEKLGSVEVKLQVDSKGKTTANFVVEHAETLQLLKLDSQQLVQSLQNAGVDTNGASLSFSLRDPNMGQAQNQQNGTPRGLAGGTTVAIGSADAAEQPSIASNRLYDIKA